jgi:hypothetical protein
LTLVVLLVLAALWAVVLVPPLLRSRTERAGDSIGDFHYRLGVLSRTNGSDEHPMRAARAAAPPVPPGARIPPVPATGVSAALGPLRLATSARAAKRRRDALRTLLGAVGITMLVAYATGAPALWAVHVLADLALGAFVGLWAWIRSLDLERAEKVRFLPAPTPAPELALRRTASS